jgi:hypothetical protein
MPEIKNTFIQGKMNKDLDERLIPNGQYRDALNIGVTSSETSDAGAIENILGNTLIGDLIPEGYTCVGSISDETTNTLYWFVKGDDRDAILRFNEGQSFVVIVDAHESSSERFLNFTGDHITGINIVDNFLFWTDGNSEPKKIDLDKKYHDDTSLSVNDQPSALLYVNGESAGDLQEQHITVIKKKPSIAPTVSINTSDSVLTTRSESIFEKIFPRFCFRYKYDSGEYSAFGPFTDVVFNPIYGLELGQFDNYTTEEPYNRAMTNVIDSIDLYDFVPSDIPKDVVQVDILYKQENSNVVYSVANIKSTDEEFTADGSQQLVIGTQGTVSKHKGKYNISTENIHAALPESQLLRPWDNVPRSALAQEITGNRLVYGNYKQGYYLDEEPKLTANYEPRKSGSFNEGGLKSIKSKRDYQVGVVLGDKYGRETPVFTSPEGSVKLKWNDDGLTLCSSSLMFNVKLDSDLPDWTDYYKFYVKQSSGEYYNLLTDKAYVPFRHVDFNNKDKHIWLSLPSSDRNKLLEDDFIMLKKVYNGNDNQFVTNDNKFQVLDIENEAPDAVKFVFSNLGEVGNSSASNQENLLAGDNTDGFTEHIFPDSARRIDVETDTIYINKLAWLNSSCSGAPLVTESHSIMGGATAAETVKDIFISWEKNGNNSDRYRVSSVSLGAVSIDANTYVLKLSKKISSSDAALCEGVSSAFLSEDLKFNISRRDERSTEDFSGKFFVKIKMDNSLIDTVSTGFTPEQIYVWSSQDTSYLYDVHNTGVNVLPESVGIVNSSTTSSQPTVTPLTGIGGINDRLNTAVEWASLLSGDDNSVGRTFFIDNLSFVSSNPSPSSYAKESGEGWFGARTQYESYSWGFNANFVRPVSTPDADFIPAAEISGLPDGYYGWRFGEPASASSQESGSLLTGVLQEGFAVAAQNVTGSGFGLQPYPYLSENEAIVNGIDGFMISGLEHTGAYAGYKRWLSDTIYSGTSLSGENTDTTYGEVNTTGKFFLHLSFLAPGVDLHDGNFGVETGLVGVTRMGHNSIASKLQGIWGGGVFTKFGTDLTIDGTDMQPADDFAQGPDTAFDLNIYNQVEFEGNYNSDNEPQEIPPGPGIVGSGYDLNYFNRHSNQWNPAYQANGIMNEDILEFVNNITNLESFRFSGDPDGEIYKIMSVSVKHLYNHTSWRARRIWEGNEYTAGNNSVEEAASTWADSVADDEGGHVAHADDLKQKIQDFGAAHNRRVCYIIELDKDPTSGSFWDPTVGYSDAPAMSLTASSKIEFISDTPPLVAGQLVSYPAIWETEPNQVSDLNIYYEASGNIPTNISDNKEEIFAPVGSRVFIEDTPNASLNPNDLIISGSTHLAQWSIDADNTIFKVKIEPGFPALNADGDENDYTDAVLKFVRIDGSYTTCKISDDPNHGPDEWNDFASLIDLKTSFIVNAELDPKKRVGLSWYNCFSFGDGIESNRIRDGFNKMQITNGARASATLEEPYSEEMRKSGLIYSGIYNSNSGVNNLNQFIQAEKITKDLNPTYGSIQKLFSRNTDLIALCEDRVLKILANKDALFNADGNPQLIASSQVLGQAVAFVGDFGISKNPESFASESYRAYFSDKQRGAVLRLSMDGLTPISDAGMRDYFRDNLAPADDIIGSYDDYSKQYNITLTKHSEGGTTGETLSFSEDAKGWVSFKSFIPESGVSLSNQYFTMNKGELWQHNLDKDVYNRFYDVPYPSSVTAILNDSPSVIKNFNTLNYEGSQASVEGYTTYMSGETQISNLAPYNTSNITGWEASEIYNSDESGFVTEFIEKEGKWFNYIKGGDIEDNSLQQTSKFSVQGLGIVKNEK